MTIAERKRRRVAQPGFWSRQAENTLDRATAMMPRLLYERLRRVRHRLRDHLPDRRPARAADRRRRHPARGRSRSQRRHRGLLPQPERPDDPGRDHPDAHAGRGHRGARVRHQASSGRRWACSAAACRAVSPPSPGRIPDASRLAVWYDVLALDSDHDYDPVWAKCRELGIAPTFHSAGSNQGLRTVPVELRLQPHRALRAPPATRFPRRSSWAASPGASPSCGSPSSRAAWAGPASSSATCCEHWERRNRKALEQHGSAQARSRAADEPGREVRRPGRGRGAAGARMAGPTTTRA